MGETRNVQNQDGPEVTASKVKSFRLRPRPSTALSHLAVGTEAAEPEAEELEEPEEPEEKKETRKVTKVHSSLLCETSNQFACQPL